MSTQDITARDLQIEQSIFITKVYGWMSAALAITGLVAWFTAASPSLLGMIFSSRFVFFGLIIAELICVAVLVGVVNRISSQLATAIFIGYSVLNGLTLSVIFLVYTTGSISSTFFITAATFALMSLYGYTTKTDLTKLGNLALMALIGIVIASLVNLFWQNETLYWVTTYLGVLVFVGLTAYDTQKIKNISAEMEDGTETAKKGAILGALTLYLDFINLFLLLLRIMGRRK